MLTQQFQIACCVQVCGVGYTSLLQSLFQNGELVEFLYCECKPRVDFRVQLGFVREVHRHVQQRTGGRDPKAVTQARVERSEALEQIVNIGSPDVAPVDDAQRQHLIDG